MEPTIVAVIESNNVQSTEQAKQHKSSQPIKDVTPIDSEPQTSALMVHNPENYINLDPLTTSDTIVPQTITSTQTDETLTFNNTLKPSTLDPGRVACPQTSIIISTPIIESNINHNHDSNKNNDNHISDTLLHKTTNQQPLNTITSTTALSPPTNNTKPIEIIENETKSIQENTDLTQNLHQTETSSEQKMDQEVVDNMDVDENNVDLTLNDEPNKCENNHNIDNDSGIGTEPKIQKQSKQNDKEEMDVDEEEVLIPDPNIMIDTDCNKAQTANTYNHEATRNKADVSILNIDAGYDEELDEDFNADEEEDEDDESNEGSEDIAGDDDDSDNLLSELADIDIVCDDTMYTEEAPRWITSQQDLEDGEFNVEGAYESWERDKQQFGTIYSDREGAENDNEEAEDRGDFFASLLNKYGMKKREDPEKDNIKNKGGDYKLDDNFIDDGDCFEQHGVETIFGGFFIAKGNIDIKSPQSRPNSPKKRKKLPNIPETYKKDIENIEKIVKDHQHVLESIRDPKQRYASAVISNQDMYLKFTRIEELKQEEKHVEMKEDSINVYSTLLFMLVEFDTILLRDKISGGVKQAIYHELASIFEYGLSESNRKQQQNFEELMNWFSYDWFDDKDDVRKGKKMNWRILFLEILEKRAKARFHGRMNKVRKDTADSTEKVHEKKYQAADIPWDQIVSDIFLMSCYSMESMALIDGDMDKAAHECHMQLRESISKYLEGGTKDITMVDIEKRYNEQTKKVFPNESYCYSYLVTQRIKEIKRNEKKQKKTPKKTPKRATPKKAKPAALKQPVVDLTDTESQNNDDNTTTNKAPQMAPIPPVFQNTSVEYPINTISTEPHIRAIATNPLNNVVIDLTGNEVNNTNTNDLYITTSVSMSATNTPKTEQKATNNNNKRKRRRSEMETTQNPFASTSGIETIDTELTQNPFASKSISPPNKRRKLTEKSVIEPQVDKDGVNASKLSMVLPINQLIAVSEAGTLHDGGATICFLMNATDEGIRYRYYESGAISKHYIPTHFCYLIKNYSISDLSKPVLALKRNKLNDGYEAKYVLANVTHIPQHRNDVIGVKYMHNEQEVKMQTRTSLNTPFPHYGTFMLPTVIPVISLLQIMAGNISPVNKNKNVNNINDNNTNVNTSDNHNTLNTRQSNSPNNGNRKSKIIIDDSPPSSNIFYRKLPVDPWNDQHFQAHTN